MIPDYGIPFSNLWQRSLGVEVIDSWPACHEFETRTVEDSPCRGAMHVKSVESSNVLSLVWLFKKGISFREIAKIVGRSHSCVQKIIGRFKSDGLIENKCRRGRKSILSDVAKRKVLKDIKTDPKLSAVKLAAETSRIMGRSVNAETVRNVIRHAGYSSRVARKKPCISLQNQKKRLEFAKTHRLKTDNFWKKVIFSDESKFNIFGSDGCRTVWRKPNTALDPKNLRPTVEHGGGSVMVWDCMASNGVGNLVFIDGIMDHKLYIDILNKNLTESAKNWV
ncbi:transposable element Tcb1 transposase [Trichonephila clavipes]|nr:transposable element Tcb1 transposase [Trichonephila clavipes]